MKMRDLKLQMDRRVASSFVAYLSTTRSILLARLACAFLSISLSPVPWCGIANGETFSSPGYYTVTSDGWVRSGSPIAFTYRCTSCKEQVEIKIEYGPPLGDIAPWKTNEEFMASISTASARRQFAEDLMQALLRNDSRMKVELKHIGLGEVGGLQVLLIASEVTMGSSVVLDTSLIAVHKSRIMRCAVQLPAGTLSPDDEKAVDAFIDGIAFEK
jgi:hypothetical protein